MTPSAKGPFESELVDQTPYDGKVGPYKRVLRSMYPPSVGKRVVKEAAKDIGYHEMPAGSNSTKFGKRWGQDKVPWCGMALASWWQLAGLTVTRELALQIDYVPQLISLATRKLFKLKLVSKNSVRAGDAVCYDFPSADGVADHVGVFERWINKKEGTFYAIEGNTSKRGSQDNGGSVERQVRNVSSVIAFVRKMPG